MIENRNKGRKKTHDMGTALYAVHILNILEKYTGVTSSGEIKYLKVSGENSIQSHMEKYYNGCKIDRNTISSILSRLCDLDSSDLPKVKSLLDKKGNRTVGYYVEDPKLDAGEFAMLSSLIQYAPTLRKKTKRTLQKKILSLTDETYAKTIGLADIDSKNDELKSDIILVTAGKLKEAISYNKKVSFCVNEYMFDKQLHRTETECDVIFSPFELISNNDFMYVIGLRDGESSLVHYRVDKLSSVKMLDSMFERSRYVDTQKYIDEHPFMKSAKFPVLVSMLIKESAVGNVIDEFGLRIDVKKSSKEGFLQVSLTAAEEDIVMWALMNSNDCEILLPQKIRDRIGVIVRNLSEYKYLRDENDYYRDSLEKAKEKGHLLIAFPGFEDRHEHKELVDIESLHVNLVTIKDISFIEVYQRLRLLQVTSHYVNDFSVLGRLPELQAAYITAEKVKNLAFINESKTLRYLCVFKSEIDDFFALYRKNTLDEICLDAAVIEKLDLAKVKAANPVLIVKKYNGGVNLAAINWTARVERHFDSFSYPFNVIYATHDDVMRPKYNKKSFFDVPVELFCNDEFEKTFKELYKNSDDATRYIVSAVFEKGLSINEVRRELLADGEQYVKLRNAYIDKDVYVKGRVEKKLGYPVTDFIVRVIGNFATKIKKTDMFVRVYNENKARVENDDVRASLEKERLNVMAIRR